MKMLTLPTLTHEYTFEIWRKGQKRYQLKVTTKDSISEARKQLAALEGCNVNDIRIISGKSY